MQRTVDMPETLSREARQWGMFAHLSALIGLLGNGIGFIVGPLAVWLFKKEDDPFIDDQGKEAVNFQLTMFLALFLCAPLILVVVGIPLMIAVFVMMVVFPIIGAVRANEGTAYRYPLCIRFLK